MSKRKEMFMKAKKAQAKKIMDKQKGKSTKKSPYTEMLKGY